MLTIVVLVGLLPIGIFIVVKSVASRGDWATIVAPVSGVSSMVIFVAALLCIAEALSAGSELEKSIQRGNALREHARFLGQMRDQKVKAELIVEIYQFNKKINDAAKGRRSQWTNIFWAEGWADVAPIELPEE